MGVMRRVEAVAKHPVVRHHVQSFGFSGDGFPQYTREKRETYVESLEFLASEKLITVSMESELPVKCETLKNGFLKHGCMLEQ